MAETSSDSFLGGTRMFQPLTLRALELKNRVFKAATHDGAEFGEMRRTYTRLARNDVALITVAYVAVSPVNKTFDTQHHIGYDNANEWQKLCFAVHAAGGKISAQLHHPGLFCMSSEGKPMGPSFFWLPSKFSWPRTMTVQDLADVKAEFVAAAKLCATVGFDCIELHCGHGYLLSQFLTPVINRRSDRYGGSPQGRAEFPREILHTMRQVLGEDFPIVVKMNADDGFPIPGGLKLEESLQIARIFATAGADAIIPSFGYTSLNGFGMLHGNVPYDKMAEALPGGSKWIFKLLGPYVVPQIDYESLFLRNLTTHFVRCLADTLTSVIYVGGADSFGAIEEVLGDGNIAVQLGRPLIREPFFVRRIKKQCSSVGDIHSKCIRCNYCTLASIDPNRYKAGCPFLKPDDGIDIEDIDRPARL